MCDGERDYDHEVLEKALAAASAKRAERTRTAVREKFPHLSLAEQQALIDGLLAQKVCISVCS